MVTDVFLYVQFLSVYLGQKIVDGFTFGSFDYTANFDQPTLQLLVDTVQEMFTALSSWQALLSDYRALGVETNLRVTGINVYAKGGTGTTVAQNKAGYNLVGTRPAVGESQPSSPTSTFSCYFPALIYGETGCKWGLPGVYETDSNAGLLVPSGNGAIAAQTLVDHANGDFEAGDVEGANFNLAKISRIPYVTSGGKNAYRMPFESTDEPVVVKVGSGSISSILGTNNLRKPGRGQ